MKLHLPMTISALLLASTLGCGDDDGDGGDDATVGDATLTDAMLSDANSGDGSTADGATGDGAAGDGSVNDGAVEDGGSADGALEDATIADASFIDGSLVSCTGTPTACSTFDDSASCTGQAGCVGRGTCSGELRRCGTYTTIKSCTAAKCTWTTPCTKNGAACADHKTRLACSSDPQCAFGESGCEQDARVTPCASRTVQTQCSARAGCAWDDDAFACAGTAETCESQAALACLDQDGCELQ